MSKGQLEEVPNNNNNFLNDRNGLTTHQKYTIPWVSNTTLPKKKKKKNPNKGKGNIPYRGIPTEK